MAVINIPTISLLGEDYFDCPHCGVKRVSYGTVTNAKEDRKFPEGSEFFRWGVTHAIIQCRRTDCQRLTYLQILTDFNRTPDSFETERKILFCYPSQKVDLPEYIPANIRKFYKEAVDAFNFGLSNSASVMCRKTIYELCDKKGAEGKDYREKIQGLGLDKRITDPLLNIKSIGDETVHAKGWDRETIGKAIDALGIIIDMLYVQEERLKDFTKQFSKAKQGKKTLPKS